MYYEEKIINGVLMYRTTPNGEWRERYEIIDDYNIRVLLIQYKLDNEKEVLNYINKKFGIGKYTIPRLGPSEYARPGYGVMEIHVDI